jgi:hypothetical protein
MRGWNFDGRHDTCRRKSEDGVEQVDRQVGVRCGAEQTLEDDIDFRVDAGNHDRLAEVFGNLCILPAAGGANPRGLAPKGSLRPPFVGMALARGPEVKMRVGKRG